MASLSKKNGIYNVSFWLPSALAPPQGRLVMRSCKTKLRKEADTIRLKVDETLNLIRTGRLAIPSDVDAADFVFSGGTARAAIKVTTLKAAVEAYLSSAIDKAKNTLGQERTHLGHFCRLIGEEKQLDRIELATLQGYAEKRALEPNRRGQHVSSKTIKKELTTFCLLWSWAIRRGHVRGLCPVKDKANPKKLAISLEKPKDSEPFRTWDEITRKIKLEKLDEKAAEPIWARLYLDEKQLAELFEHVRQSKRYSFMYLPFLLAGCSGMRRSEIAAARSSDVNLDEGLLIIREKKRDKKKASTTRRCVLSGKLKEHLEAVKVEREFLVGNREGKRMTVDSLSDCFSQVTKNSKWENVKGFHTLRHSFASICLRKGIPQQVTAKWMGHTTQQMTELYQKVFLSDERDYAKLLG